MQLIHMNGCMYDYNNGRFLSVDPFIQAPTSTQSLNPYTYIFNNPLSGVDPTGYCSTSDKIGDCGKNLEIGQSEAITNESGDIIGYVTVDKSGEKVYTDSNNENPVALSNGSQTDTARVLLNKFDVAISEIKSTISEKRKRNGSPKFNGGSPLIEESEYLGELQSKRKLLAKFIELSKSCEPKCKGTIPKEMIDVFAKLTQSFGVNVSMSTLGGGISKAAPRTMTAKEGTTAVFRVQGGLVPNASKVRIKIDSNGIVSIVGDDMLFINVGQESRALEFLAKRGENASLVEFRVSNSFVEKLRNTAVEQRVGKANPGLPQKVDQTRAIDQFGIPSDMFDELIKNIEF
jgi:hypothetical protein